MEEGKSIAGWSYFCGFLLILFFLMGMSGHLKGKVNEFFWDRCDLDFCGCFCHGAVDN